MYLPEKDNRQTW